MSARTVLLRVFAVWPLVTLGLSVLQAAWPGSPTPARTLVLTAFLVEAICLIIVLQVAQRNF